MPFTPMMLHRSPSVELDAERRSGQTYSPRTSHRSPSVQLEASPRPQNTSPPLPPSHDGPIIALNEQYSGPEAGIAAALCTKTSVAPDYLGQNLYTTTRPGQSPSNSMRIRPNTRFKLPLGHPLRSSCKEVEVGRRSGREKGWVEGSRRRTVGNRQQDSSGRCSGQRDRRRRAVGRVAGGGYVVGGRWRGGMRREAEGGGLPTLILYSRSRNGTVPSLAEPYARRGTPKLGWSEQRVNDACRGCTVVRESGADG
ncbi:hypothetical protein GGX14DRAFT_396736 [Mycena pura]|uniref:Uncharacterized protein n=1 Tax=Mycena pura TaxID=153505 RepID=A0AAD6Y9D5_9AGAR|nr:hypothetical protein GGX14DRAFT_396736 [Mycena pura]